MPPCTSYCNYIASGIVVGEVFFFLIEDTPLCFYNIKYIYVCIYRIRILSLKHNNCFILYVKFHKTRAASFGVLPSSGPSEN